MKNHLLFSNISLLLFLNLSLVLTSAGFNSNTTGCVYNGVTVPVGTTIGSCTCTESGWVCRST